MQNIPIFFASNDKYSNLLSVAICSICYNTKNFINFYVLDGGIANFHKKQIMSLKNKFNNLDIEFIKINTFNEFKNFKETKIYPVDIYLRFLIPEIKSDLDKVIYLDCDVIVLNDIYDLYNIDLDDYILGAVPEHYYHNSISNLKNNIQIENEHKYFNSGVLLLNCKKWREQNITKKLFKIEERFRDTLICPDQDILNKYFENNYKILSFKYNLKSGDIFYNDSFKKDNKIDFVIKEIEEIKDNPLIKHFNSPDRAWKNNKGYDNSNIVFFEDFWFFARMSPFYEGMLNNFVMNVSEHEKNQNHIIETIKIFNLITLFKIKTKLDKKIIYLFGFIPIFRIKKITK